MKWLEIKTEKTAAELFEPFSNQPHSFFLDSSSEGRYSFLGAFPYKVVQSLEKIEEELHALSKIKIQFSSALTHIPFLGGAVGFISYEAIRQWETHLGPSRKEPFHIPDILFGFYDTFFVVDHLQNRTFLITLELTSHSNENFIYLKETVSSTEENRENSLPSFRKYSTEIKRSEASHSGEYLLKEGTISSNLSYDEYERMLQKAKEYIKYGEIYQVNLSHCFQTSSNTPPYTLYKNLRTLNPAPFSAYLNFGEGQILCSSPERFLQTNSQGLIQTEPIKGTVRRGQTPSEDESLKRFLLESEKNRAELMMIVDLERNDLGKICQLGSICVPTLYELRSYATVHHLVSVIQGHLKTKKLTDILHACFPGGSITGAPKLRAMQIIDELEHHNRGIYTGALGYIDSRGQMDLNIAIRTIMHQNGNIFFPVGGGIVWDSDPKEEYEETLHKGRALTSAVSQ